MAKPTPQQCHAMTTFYVQEYKARHGQEPVVNRHSARWGFESVLTGMPPKEVKELIVFYLDSASKTPSLDWFFYNYDKLILKKEEVEEDKRTRARLREESRIRAEEWRARGNTGVESNQLGSTD
jgi:hypothetical protein